MMMLCAGAVLRLHSECTTWLFEFTALNNSPLQIDGKNQFVHSIFFTFASFHISQFQVNQIIKPTLIFQLRGPNLFKFTQI